MGRTRDCNSRKSGNARRGEEQSLKFGLIIDPEDLELLRLAARESRTPVEFVASVALSWGCQKLREGAPRPLPPEAGGDAPGASWAN